MTPGSPDRPAGGPRDRSLAVGTALLALFLASQYGYALAVAFINDDYVFLDKTRAASFLSLWEPKALAFHWYRPWSRELHYWVIQRWFGAHELPFHLASFALALAAMSGYFVLTRRLAGGAAAAIATAGVAALAAWGVPMVWVAGVQDLWLLVFAMVFLLAVTAGSRAGAVASLVLALLSKEAAAVLPAVAAAYLVLVERRRAGDVARRVAPLLAVVALWGAFHPVLGGRWRHPITDPLEPGLHPPLAQVALKTLLVPLNLDAVPAPESGWGPALWRAASGAVLLGALALLALREERPGRAPGRVTGFALAWAGLGWLPLVMPSLGWHAYYALLGALGAWLAIAIALARRPLVAAALVAGLALLRGARAETPSRDWGSEAYQRRAAEFIAFMRGDLLRQVPAPPPYSRFYFVRVPSNVGFLAGDAPALRVWYGDSTLRGGFYPSYRRRRPDQAAGPDWFFRYDSTTGWVPVRRGAEDVAAARRANPRWVIDHEALARTLAAGGDWTAAGAEYRKLADAESSRVDFAYNAGVCYETLGDSSRAAVWYARAAALPGADRDARETAARFARHLGGPAARRGRR